MTDTAQGDEIEGLRAFSADLSAVPEYADEVAMLERAATELASLRERLAKAEEERDGLRRSLDNAMASRVEWRRLAETAEARTLLAEGKLAEAKGALAFYADEDRYRSRLVTEACGCCTYEQHAEIGPDGDEGDRARATLSNLETQETRHDRHG